MRSKHVVCGSFLAACASLIILPGCARHESEARAQAGINQAEAVGDRNVAAAQRKVDVTAAEAARNIAKQRCEVEAGAALAACQERADIEFETVRSQLRAEDEASSPPTVMVPR
jgi:hypothetical protein